MQQQNDEANEFLLRPLELEAMTEPVNVALPPESDHTKRRQHLFCLTCFATLVMLCLIIGGCYALVDHLAQPITRHELDHTIRACPGAVVIQEIAEIALYTGCIFSVGSPNATVILLYTSSCDNLVISAMPSEASLLNVITYSNWYRTYHVIRMRLLPLPDCGGKKMMSVQTIEPAVKFG